LSDDLLGPQTLEKAQLERKIAIANERTKLLANAFDRASTAVLSVGLFGPIASGLYGLGASMPWDRLVAWFVIWFAAAGALHLVARRFLGGLT
jgi:hypothetical protein